MFMYLKILETISFISVIPTILREDLMSINENSQKMCSFTTKRMYLRKLLEYENTDLNNMEVPGERLKKESEHRGRGARFYNLALLG